MLYVYNQVTLLLCIFFTRTPTTEIYTLSLHDALPILQPKRGAAGMVYGLLPMLTPIPAGNCNDDPIRSEEHTSELQSRVDLVCRLLLEKKKGMDYIVL